MDTEAKEALFKKLLAKQERNNRQFYMPYYGNGVPSNPDTLANLLSLDSSMLTEDGKQILDYLENEDQYAAGAFNYATFKWKLTAFLCLQDIFGMPIHTGSNRQNLFQLRYFYYESKYLLIESILGSLNGLHVINKQALRNFIEFNLLQNYFFNITTKTGSYAIFNSYLKSYINPSMTKVLEKALPNDAFCKPLKKRVQAELSNLSNRYSHAYAPIDSPKQFGVFSPDTSIDSLYFWIPISVALDVVLWTYYVNLPMLFFPVDILAKFGFNWPVGLYITDPTSEIIRKATTEADYLHFQRYAATHAVVADLRDFYDSQATLTEDQIWATWTKEKQEGDTIRSCFAKAILEQRTLSELMAVNAKEVISMTEEELTKKEALQDKVIKNFTEFHAWSKVYKRMK